MRRSSAMISEAESCPFERKKKKREKGRGPHFDYRALFLRDTVSPGVTTRRYASNTALFSSYYPQSAKNIYSRRGGGKFCSRSASRSYEFPPVEVVGLLRSSRNAVAWLYFRYARYYWKRVSGEFARALESSKATIRAPVYAAALASRAPMFF